MAFANIDWKNQKHGRRFAYHAGQMSETVLSIVCRASPAAICFCEVGTASEPLSPENRKELCDIISREWKQHEPAATEHGVEFLFQDNLPYLTAYRPDLLRCTQLTAIHDLYHSGGCPRTAQLFLATPICASDAGINIINVHAPSGSSNRLKDSQRRDLVATLLRHKSLRHPNTCIGRDRFIIGGDMNTGVVCLQALLIELREQEKFVADTRMWRPHRGKHGDMGIAGGVQGEVMNCVMHNHDPQHMPYAFRWKFFPNPVAPQPLGAHGRGSVTEQPVPAEDATQAADDTAQPAGETPQPLGANAPGCATEQHVKAKDARQAANDTAPASGWTQRPGTLRIWHPSI